MLTTRADLIARLLAEGFKYLGDARAGEMVDQAASDVVLEELWPQRLVSETIAYTPLAPPSGALGQVVSVVDSVTKRPLEPSTMDDLRERYGDLSENGTPRTYYLDEVDGQVSSFPVATTPLWVRHYTKLPWKLGGYTPANNDTPRIDVAFRDLILLRAKVAAFNDTNEEDRAAATMSLYDSRLEEARSVLLKPQRDERKKQRVRAVRPEDWA